MYFLSPYFLRISKNQWLVLFLSVFITRVELVEKIYTGRSHCAGEAGPQRSLSSLTSHRRSQSHWDCSQTLSLGYKYFMRWPCLLLLLSLSLLLQNHVLQLVNDLQFLQILHALYSTHPEHSVLSSSARLIPLYASGFIHVIYSGKHSLTPPGGISLSEDWLQCTHILGLCIPLPCSLRTHRLTHILYISCI